MATSTDILPPEETAALLALSDAKIAIVVALESGDVDTLFEWHDKMAATEHYFRRRADAKEIADNAGEVKVRAEAALGRLDIMVSPGRGRPTGNAARAPSPLARLETHRRSEFRKLGRLEGGQLDTVLTTLRGSNGGVTTAGAVKLAGDFIPSGGRRTSSTRQLRVGSQARLVKAQVTALCQANPQSLTLPERDRLRETCTDMIEVLCDFRDLLAR